MRAAAAEAAEATTVLPKKLRAKKQAAQAAAAAAAERERRTLYSELGRQVALEHGLGGLRLRGLQPPTSGALRLQKT
jgi:hypothetical protein